LIGDSQAWSAYFGIAEFNSSIGLNTLLLARVFTAGGPVLFGAEADTVINNTELKQRNQVFLGQMFEILSRPEIKAVFIVLHPNNALKFRANIQPSIDKLNEAGKRVFMVGAWPSLPKSGLDYLERPYAEFFKPGALIEHSQLERDMLIKSRQEYLQLLRSMKNATIIDNDTWDAFCPAGECLAFSERGRLLYFDTDHLTLAGSEFLAEKVLAPYLKEIAATQ
jgi:hypothetical protein